MLIMLVVYVIPTESAPVCYILKVRFLCADCDQRRKKFPFLRKKKVNFSYFLPIFFGSLECYCFPLR